MKTKLLLSLFLGALLLAGCGKKEEASVTAASAPGPRTFDFTADDAMKYNLTRIEVQAGEEVRITLFNNGNIPRQAMGHNWILLQAGTDTNAFLNAALAAAATDYFPVSLADRVIAHTKLLGPKQRDELNFKAPAQPGEYVFLCSFPAHFAAGMHGVMVVK